MLATAAAVANGPTALDHSALSYGDEPSCGWGSSSAGRSVVGPRIRGGGREIEGRGDATDLIEPARSIAPGAANAPGSAAVLASSAAAKAAAALCGANTPRDDTLAAGLK